MHRFLKDGLEAELLREMCEGGLILQHKCLVTLTSLILTGEFDESMTKTL